MSLKVVLLIALVGVTLGQDYKPSGWEPSTDYDPSYYENDWKPYMPIGVVGGGGGCCLPEEFEAFEGMALARAMRGPPNMILV